MGVVGVMIFDTYKALLQVDQATFDSWQDTLEVYEQQAILTAQNLNPDVAVNAGNKLLQKYCEEVVVINIYGFNLSAALFRYHAGKIAEYEEMLRYGGGSQ